MKYKLLVDIASLRLLYLLRAVKRLCEVASSRDITPNDRLSI